MIHLITFYDEVTGLVDEGRAADIVYLDFDVVSCNILVEKLMTHGLEEQRVRWIANWMNCQAQRGCSITKSRVQ